MDEQSWAEKIKATEQKQIDGYYLTGKMYGATIHNCDRCGAVIAGNMVKYCYECSKQLRSMIPSEEEFRTPEDDLTLFDTRYLESHSAMECRVCGHMYMQLPIMPKHICAGCLIKLGKPLMTVDELLGMNDGDSDE